MVTFRDLQQTQEKLGHHADPTGGLIVVGHDRDRDRLGHPLVVAEDLVLHPLFHHASFYPDNFSPYKQSF